MITDQVPDDRDVDVVQAFADALRRRHREAGEPSYTTIDRAVGISKATISRALRGDRLPGWPVVAGLLHACGVSDQELDDDWKPYWVATADVAKPRRRRSELSTTTTTGNTGITATRTGIAPAPPSATTVPSTVGPAPGSVCGQCGAWVVDDALHRQWHVELLAALHTGPSVVPNDRRLRVVVDDDRGCSTG